MNPPTLTTGDFPHPSDTTMVGTNTSLSLPAALTAIFHSSISANTSNTGLLATKPPSRYLSVELEKKNIKEGTTLRCIPKEIKQQFF